MRHNSLQVGDRVEERLRKKIALWKRQYISKGGRLTLIKSTLSNTLIYTMSLFRIPIHFVNWNTVSSSKRKGGLGIRRLRKVEQVPAQKMELEASCGGQPFLERSN